MNYTLNVPLLRQLPELSTMGIMKTLDAIHVDYATWNKRVSNEQANSNFSGPSVEQVLRLCNVMRVPVRYLFTTEGEPDILPSIQELCLPVDGFKPYRFDWKQFKDYFGNRGKLRKSAIEIMRMLGMSKKPYFSWFEDHETLRIPALLLFCRTFEVDLFSLIIDPNKPSSSKIKKPVKKLDVPSVEEQLRNELEQIKKRLDASRKKAQTLQKENDALKSDNIRLTGDLMEAQHENALLRKRLNNLFPAYKYQENETKLVAEANPVPEYGNPSEEKSV